MIEWSEGQWVEARVSQYMAFIDGRIEEVALDLYAQADDGSVWYLGEDVFDYSAPRAWSTPPRAPGSPAGMGPPEMIMPADPQVGDVHRPRTSRGSPSRRWRSRGSTRPCTVPPARSRARWSPVSSTTTDLQRQGLRPRVRRVFHRPRGRGRGDGPGRAHRCPRRPVPPELEALSAAANDLLDPALAGDWSRPRPLRRPRRGAWDRYQQGEVPPRLAAEMDRALKTLGAAIGAHDRGRAGTAAIDVAQSTLDLELRYRPPAEIDLARFELWARQVLVHGAAGDMGGVNGDVATLDWVRDRFAHTIEPADITRINAHLEVLREAVVDVDRQAAVDEAPRLLRSRRPLRRPDRGRESVSHPRRQKGPEGESLGAPLLGRRATDPLGQGLGAIASRQSLLDARERLAAYEAAHEAVYNCLVAARPASDSTAACRTRSRPRRYAGCCGRVHAAEAPHRPADIRAWRPGGTWLCPTAFDRERLLEMEAQARSPPGDHVRITRRSCSWPPPIGWVGGP